MTIIVHGLGIIGASLCAALKRAGHTVFGRNRSADVCEYALLNGMIDGVAGDYRGADVVFLALPPEIIKRELDEGEFDDGQIISDICGVKGCLEELVFSKERNYRYVGIHPMAGKETTGIASAEATLFDGKNVVLVRNERTEEEAFSVVRSLCKDMGFGNFVVCSAKEHDARIALTSQLAHVVSNAYVKSDTALGCKGFTGGSFQDMTRVGFLSKEVWAQLFLLNREELLSELSNLIGNLAEYEKALCAGDEKELLSLLEEGNDAYLRTRAGD